MQRDKRQSDRVMVDAPDLARQLFARLRAGLPSDTTVAVGGPVAPEGTERAPAVPQVLATGRLLLPPLGRLLRPSTKNERSFVTVLLYLNGDASRRVHDHLRRDGPPAPRRAPDRHGARPRPPREAWGAAAARGRQARHPRRTSCTSASFE